MEQLAVTVEEVAANAWPASVVQVVDGWRLRATPGIEARRSNSVLTLGGSGVIATEDRVAIAEEFYERRDLPVRLSISPATVPADLDDTLAARGFEVEAPVDLMVAELADVDAASTRDASHVRLSAEPEDVWLDTMLRVMARGDRHLLKSAVLDRIAPPVRYAWVDDGDGAVAVGMGVVERGWLGVFAMATVPEHRRRGHARAVIGALATFGLDHGATRAYLQTDGDNVASHGLYGSVGFATAYGYHYRTRR